MTNINKQALDQILSYFSGMIRNREELECVFTKESKMTTEVRKLGLNDISSYLSSQGKDFEITSYSFVKISDKVVLINGSCVWGNKKSCFTMILNFDTSVHPAIVTISNLMIL